MKELCQSEVEQVKTSLRQACEAEVRLVRESCKYEVQLVRDGLADAVRQEVEGMVSEMVRSTRQDVEVMLAEQRSMLHEAAQPYLAAVQRAQSQTVGHVAQLQDAVSEANGKVFDARAESARRVARRTVRRPLWLRCRHDAVTTCSPPCSYDAVRCRYEAVTMPLWHAVKT